MSELLNLYSGDAKFVSVVHQYDINNVEYDIILIVENTYEAITYIMVERRTSTIYKRLSFPYGEKIKKLVSEQNGNIPISILEIEKIPSVYKKISDILSFTTFFFIIKNTKTRKRYVVQCDITNHDMKSGEYQLITTHNNTSNIYLDLMVHRSVVVNDYKMLTDIDTYLMFVNIERTGSMGSATIEGARVLISSEEKSEFELLRGVELPSTILPIFDIWSEENHKFMYLTEDVTDVSFNFSTGVGFLQFANES